MSSPMRGLPTCVQSHERGYDIVSSPMREATTSPMRKASPTSNTVYHKVRGFQGPILKHFTPVKEAAIA